MEGAEGSLGVTVSQIVVRKKEVEATKPTG